MNRSRYLLVLLSFCCFVTSCKMELKEGIALQKEVSERYQLEDVLVQISNDQIRVVIANSTYKDSSAAVKTRVSNEIGVIVSSFPRIRKQVVSGITRFIDSNTVQGVKLAAQSDYPMQLK